MIDEDLQYERSIPLQSRKKKASLFFVGIATAILECELPGIYAILLSHYHADHFDQQVEAKLRKGPPTITTPYAHSCLTQKGCDSFNAVHALDFFDSTIIDFDKSQNTGGRTLAIKVIGCRENTFCPGVYLLQTRFCRLFRQQTNSYQIYISGDMLMMPLLIVTMDADKAVQPMQLINLDLTISIHYGDHSVFLLPLEDFKKVDEAGLRKVVYLDRKDQYKFEVKKVQ
ncbi:hypothetical protein CC78DRAFT_560737 [Lojkania enalia]|uniref:Metallo-beta-lactamase domain-containing protein n=1 Tax=Lojkania enalia TaxID=147567 RepID=A0A9P4N3J0_9PLEO|nr:hypothetical protein CC78DRAFT_560737 [Didymosphaeria enalia]